MKPDLSFVYDPENKTVYLLIADEEPWPISEFDARRLGIELLKATRQAMGHINEVKDE